MVASFSENLVASSACLGGVKYSVDIVVSVGSCSGLPDFRMIKTVVINTNIVFACRLMTAWYDEHPSAYELCRGHVSTFWVTHLTELNNIFPLSVYSIRGRQLVTLKRYILC